MAGSKRKKIALIGAGNIGGTLAFLAVARSLGDVVLFDVVEGLPQGKALDISHAAPVLKSSVKITGTNDYADIKDADVVIVTAGLARKPGMSRNDLLETNAKIIKSVGEGIKTYAPESFVIVVSNPLDAMVTMCQRATGFKPTKVVGMAGVLDSARYRSFLSEEIGISSTNIVAPVLGGHGDDMVPLRSATVVDGFPVTRFVDDEKLETIQKRVRGAGAEVVALLKTGSAYYSPAVSAMEMAEAYLFDQKRVLPCAAHLDGQYGLKDIYIGVPTIIGGEGVEKIIELELTKDEEAALNKSAAGVRELVALLPQ